MKKTKWIKSYLLVPIFITAMIFTFNYSVDPYSKTSYNILNIPVKYVSNNRKDKVVVLRTEPKFTNLQLGSSRVYNVNALALSAYFGGGKTYNLGVGRGLIEDSLGFLLYLEKLDKLPKNILVGLDFYSFNKNVETNLHFFETDEINFISKKKLQTNLGSFLSIAMTRDSFKTMKNFLKNKGAKANFDKYGLVASAAKIFEYYPKDMQMKTYKEEIIDKAYSETIKSSYIDISKDRLGYLEDIIALCKRHKIRLIFYVTPLNGQVIRRIQEHPEFSKSFEKFKNSISKITGYYNFLTLNELTDNRSLFLSDAKHSTTYMGNLVLAKIFSNEEVDLPDNFGEYVPKAFE